EESSGGEIDLRDEIEAEIEAATEAEEAEKAEEDAETEGDEDEEREERSEGGQGGEAGAGRRRRRRRGRRGGRGRRKELEATFDHGDEDGYGLWLDASVKDNPVYKESWAGKREVTVRIEADQIVIRRAGEPADNGSGDSGSESDDSDE
ncbi:MAG TPA: hypothetical protein VNM41_01320, partial [Solirubrobacterales bacterium]|nr:hypothetical protein [Solirubrobacterales bacterium]